MTNASWSLTAGEQLVTALGVAHGVALAWGGKKGQAKVKAHTRQMIELSTPEVL